MGGAGMDGGLLLMPAGVGRETADVSVSEPCHRRAHASGAVLAASCAEDAATVPASVPGALLAGFQEAYKSLPGSFKPRVAFSAAGDAPPGPKETDGEAGRESFA